MIVPSDLLLLDEGGYNYRANPPPLAMQPFHFESLSARPLTSPVTPVTDGAESLLVVDTGPFLARLRVSLFIMSSVSPHPVCMHA